MAKKSQRAIKPAKSETPEQLVTRLDQQKAFENVKKRLESFGPRYVRVMALICDESELSECWRGDTIDWQKVAGRAGVPRGSIYQIRDQIRHEIESQMRLHWN